MSGPAMATAYTAVQRVSHTVATTQPPPSPSHSEPKKVEWPQSVKDYVRRSFEPGREIPNISRADMERKLKEVITRAAESGQLLVVDWSTYPLPQQILQQELFQQAQTLVPQPMPSAIYTNPILGSWGQSPPSKKRKMEEIPSVYAKTTPPWRKNNAHQQSGLEDRITYANKGQADRMEKRLKKAQTPVTGSSKFLEELENRRRRFERDESPYPTRSSDTVEDDEGYNNIGTIIGTCTQLEKNYFRLTRPPIPKEVRPQYVLEQTLVLLKQKWRQHGDYGYICDQFKSMRQDLTVQHIKNSFTVDVYELHARIALEKGDLGEYNQCQTQLRALYSLNLGGHPAEFLAYRILYFILTANMIGLNEILAELTPADREQPTVKHALETRSALASGNYHRFFSLYLDVPNMGAYLMDKFIVRERLAAFTKICTAYKPVTINIRFLTEELGFESDQETYQFIVEHNAESSLEEKDGSIVLRCKTAAPIFESASQAANRRIDIKGQI